MIESLASSVCVGVVSAFTFGVGEQVQDQTLITRLNGYSDDEVC